MGEGTIVALVFGLAVNGIHGGKSYVMTALAV